ncbi:5'-nucleotidase [Aphelenchoides fujianensis]|nr:5'-nucleotidase [Aphelenchoides fujianensis]
MAASDPTAKQEARDILETLKANPKVRMRNPDEVLRKLNVLIAGGFDKLMVISDFDYTITRYADENGERTWTTHAIFENCARHLSVELQQKFEALKTKFLAIEFDPHMTIEEKTPYMEQWWRESHQYIVENKFKRTLVEEAVYESRVQLRDGAADFLKTVCEKSVPLVCFSAGIGNLIEIFLKWKLGVVPPNLHIISNQMLWDEEGVCSGFTLPLIHTFNKNASVVGQERPFFHSIRSRPYVLLLGDSMGDIHMDVGVEEEGEALRVGYLNFNIENLYDKYYESYDIVLLEDSTFDVPSTIFTHIHDSINAAGRESKACSGTFVPLSHLSLPSVVAGVAEEKSEAIEVKS